VLAEFPELGILTGRHRCSAACFYETRKNDLLFQ
jgi:hypothetical protein